MPPRSPTPGSACPRSRRWGAAAAAAWLSAASAGPLAAQQGSAYEELQAFSAVLNYVRLNYPDTVSYHALVQAAITGVLRSLDPHSAFYSRLDFERRSALERGELAVTGLSVEEVDSAITVLSVAARSPGAKAGIQPGDRLVAVNDTAVAGLTVTAVELRLAGEKGSKLRLRLERGPRLEPDSFDVTVKRDFLERRSVSFARMVDSVTGYVRLDEFGLEAGKEVHDALRRLRDRHMHQAILDLRGNPGGLVISAVAVASEFLPRGTEVFRTRGRKRDVDRTYATTSDGAFRDLPLIVLIDEHSASAAEALAATLQDHDRALLLGRRSFGKALIQLDFLVMPMQDDLRLTIGWVVSPSGRFIQRRYRGLAVEQYRAFAGKGGSWEDTTAEYRTDHGRIVRGGGGIGPDVLLPRPAPLPVWWSIAADSSFDEAVADSVALALPADLGSRQSWMSSAARWRDGLLPPYLARVRTRLGVLAQIDTVLEERLARLLAARAAEVRWGMEGREEFTVRNSPDIRAALGYFSRLSELLAARGR